MVEVGDKADLNQDIRAAIERRKKARDTNENENEPEPESDEAWSLWHLKFDTIDIALVLRLGGAELASEMWEATLPPEKGQPGKQQSDTTDPYFLMANSWGWAVFDRALDAHMRGDDVVALHGFRKLSVFGKAVEAEAKKRGYKPAEYQPALLSFYDQVPDLLKDQEDRTKRVREPIVVIGPGRESDPKKRIVALIDRLNEVNARQQGQPGGVNLGGDIIVRALIREGEVALEPLLHCFEEDQRLTRSVHFWRAFSRSRTCLGVHEAAYVALSAILAQSDFAPAFTGDNLTRRGDEARRELAKSIREHIKTANRLPCAQRWLTNLANDKARPEVWHDAAARLMADDDVANVPGTTVWTENVIRTRSRDVERPKLVAEVLRDRKNPSLTDLFLKRIDQCDDVLIGADLALILAKWDPAAANKPLAVQMKRLREKGIWYEYVVIVNQCCELGNIKVLDDYVDLMGIATPEMLGEDLRSNLFDPMIRHPNYPGMATAAEKLFGNNKRPWLPLANNSSPKGRLVRELISCGLLQLQPFRNAVIRELEEKGGLGTIRVDKYGSISMKLPDISISGGGSRNRELDIPEAGAGDKFRICDYVAWTICEQVDAAPRCELYWSEAKRDKAVAACADFLRHFGDQLLWRRDGMCIGGPATPKDVREGKAIFSLNGDGQVRVYRGLKLPVDAVWSTLKNRPQLVENRDARTGSKTISTVYRQLGKIFQAEEVFKDGRWQRFYGFAGSNHVAIVPAEEVEFPPEERWWLGDYRDWAGLDAGFHARLKVPQVPVETNEDFPPRLSAEADLIFSITVRNSRGQDQLSPAPEKSVRLRALYSPEIISPKGTLAPKAVRQADWVELPPNANARIEVGRSNVLAPTEEMVFAKVDVKKWFDISKRGFYRIQILPAKAPPERISGLVAEVRFSLALPESMRQGNE